MIKASAYLSPAPVPAACALLDDELLLDELLAALLRPRGNMRMCRACPFGGLGGCCFTTYQS